MLILQELDRCYSMSWSVYHPSVFSTADAYQQAHGGRTDPPLFRAAITSSTFMPPQYAPDDPVPTVCCFFCAHLPCRSLSKTSPDSVCMTRCLITPSKWYNHTRYVFIAYLSKLYRCNHAPDSFTCLVSVDSDTLNSANDAVALSAFYQTFIFAPVVDRTFIVERPTVTIDRQTVNGVSSMDHMLLVIWYIFSL